MTIGLFSSQCVGKQTSVRECVFHILSLLSLNCFVIGLWYHDCLGKSILPKSRLMEKLTYRGHVQQFSAGESV